MRWLRFLRQRAADRELEEAARQTSQSGEQAKTDLQISTARARASQRVAAELARHNSANRYDDWLETHFLRGGS
jgi:hypothetical protein